MLGERRRKSEREVHELRVSKSKKSCPLVYSKYTMKIGKDFFYILYKYTAIRN